MLQKLLAADRKPGTDIFGASETDSGTRVTPLGYAVRMYQPSFIRLLVEHGADLNAACVQNASGRMDWPVRVLIGALCQDTEADRSTDGALAILDCLISVGADVNASEGRRADDGTPVRNALLDLLKQPLASPASHRAREAAAMRLIEAGADVNARDEFQARPLDAAAALPSVDVFKALTRRQHRTSLNGSCLDPAPVPRLSPLTACKSQHRKGGCMCCRQRPRLK